VNTAPLVALAANFRAGRPGGMTSVCSAHPQVIAAALCLGRQQASRVLIEATCNQVNQDGGYTGMTPADFRRFVEGIAGAEGFDLSQLILGGDHLGPNPWTTLPSDAAMYKASDMVAAYAKAGFTKIHLDTSMSCADDPMPLPEAEVARRAARLAVVAERNAVGEKPVYVIGTEVPVPGGALEEVEHLVVTSPRNATETVAIHQAAFATAGIGDAFLRVVGLVVQPGVEFGNENVVAYDRAAARDLSTALSGMHMIYEAHSTDYQTPGALAALVADGFAILKVGPGLTFALREALYGLDHIADQMFAPRGESLREAMERLMTEKPGYWQKYYPGTPEHQRLQRHFSYSDRIRYYWTDPVAQAAVERLMALFGEKKIPEPLISQYLGAAYPEVMDGSVPATAPALIRAAITRVLRVYSAACG
jgi:D-tagatose-bisphosphate aldolase class II non-catalytic subunit